MDQSLHTPKPYDYRQYDRIWQRVAPELEPYPGWKEQAVPALADLTPSGGTSGTVGGAGTAAQGADAAPEAASRTEAPQEAQPSAGLTLAEEAQLPGAEENPCCMGTAASEMLAVIQSFIDAELLDQRYDQALARQAPSWARVRMRELAAAAGARARRLPACRGERTHLDAALVPRPAGAVPRRGLRCHELPAGGGRHHGPLPLPTAGGAGRGRIPPGGPAAGSAGAGNAAVMSETGRGDCPALCFVL